MAALEMLNIMAMSQPDKQGPQGTVELHRKIEAMRLAYTDLYRYNGDPRLAKIPVRGLLSKEYAEQRAALIDPQKANCAVVNGTPAKSDTTCLAAVDKEGNIASLIQSVYDCFGSGVAVKGNGFLLQDRGGLFVLDPKHPDALAPHKRPFHTIIPAFVERGGEHIGFGIYGWFESATGARAIRVQRRGLWMEHPGSAFGSTLHGPRHWRVDQVHDSLGVASLTGSTGPIAGEGP